MHLYFLHLEVLPRLITSTMELPHIVFILLPPAASTHESLAMQQTCSTLVVLGFRRALPISDPDKTSRQRDQPSRGAGFCSSIAIIFSTAAQNCKISFTTTRCCCLHARDQTWHDLLPSSMPQSDMIALAVALVKSSSTTPSLWGA